MSSIMKYCSCSIHIQLKWRQCEGIKSMFGHIIGEEAGTVNLLVEVIIEYFVITPTFSTISLQRGPVWKLFAQSEGNDSALGMQLND